VQQNYYKAPLHVNLHVWKIHMSFIAFLDNYNAETGKSEYESIQHMKEMRIGLSFVPLCNLVVLCKFFIGIVLPIANDKDINVPSDKEGFMKLLYSIWFDTYNKRDRNSNVNDSSGFEHVFVGEIKNEKVSGFHNWITYYREERSGCIDFRGYIKPKNY
jgi:poly(U)-specific endoribonuclease